MASRRLTKELRGEILHNIMMQTKFNANSDESKKLREKEAKLADKLWSEIHKGYEDEMLRLADAGIMTRYSKMNIRVYSKEKGRPKNDRGMLYFDMNMSEPRPLAEGVRYGGGERGVLHDEVPVVKQILALKEEVANRAAASKSFRNKTKDVLNSVNTVKRLREVWPECEEFLPEGIDLAHKLPAVATKELSDMLERVRVKKVA